MLIYEGANEFLEHTRFNLPCSNIISSLAKVFSLHNLFAAAFYAKYSNTAEFIFTQRI